MKALIYFGKENTVKDGKIIDFNSIDIPFINDFSNEITAKNYDHVMIYVEYDVWDSFINSSFSEEFINFISGGEVDEAENPYKNFSILVENSEWEKLDDNLSGGERKNIDLCFSGYNVKLRKISRKIKTKKDLEIVAGSEKDIEMIFVKI